MREIIVAGNWKMYKTSAEANQFTESIIANLQGINLKMIKPVICTPYVFLEQCNVIAGGSSLQIAAQDVSKYEVGAYTGEVSAPMLKSIGVKYCIIGHSERRQYHNESDNDIREKLLRLVEQNIIPIVCIGERAEEREAGLTADIIKTQLSGIFRDIEIKDPGNYIIAYEPVWAIGTGKTATPAMAQEVHKLIRKWIEDHYSNTIAAGISILYGGSVKPDNFYALLKEEDIDGGLIGGASLNVDDYWHLLQTALSVANKEN
jgi:triosephosphate isomerase